jgi:DNA-binding IclR family transcriptional regulator
MPRPKLTRPLTAKATRPLRQRGSKQDPRFNTALARGLDILRSFREGDHYLGNVELSERTGIPNSTVSRLTFTLQQLGYLHYISNLGKYQLGPSVLDLGYGVLANIDVHVVARPLMTALATESGGSVTLAILDETEMIMIESARGSAPARNISVGMKAPVFNTSLGWACLAGMPEDAREVTMQKLEVMHSADWRRVRGAIVQGIKEVETRGYCITIGGYHDFASAVGVPVRWQNDDRHMALNCVAPSVLFKKDQLIEKWGPRLVELAKAIHGNRA